MLTIHSHIQHKWRHFKWRWNRWTIGIKTMRIPKMKNSQLQRRRLESNIQKTGWRGTWKWEENGAYKSEENQKRTGTARHEEKEYKTARLRKIVRNASRVAGIGVITWRFILHVSSRRRSSSLHWFRCEGKRSERWERKKLFGYLVKFLVKNLVIILG